MRISSAKNLRSRLLVATITILLASCSVREDLVLAPDGSGTAFLEIELHPVMVRYIGDLMSAMTGVDGEFAIFDEAQIRSSFAERDGVTLRTLSRRARGSMAMEISFEDISRVLDNAGVDVFSFRTVGSRREFVLTLDRAAVQSFLGFAPAESMTMAEFLLPPEDGSVSAGEYREEIAWALEEYESRTAVERIIDESAIEVRVRPEGRIVSQRGGTVREDVVVFSIPVVELLTLRSERVYSLSFVP